MIKAMVLWCCLVGSAYGAGGDVWLDLNLGSKHFGGSDGYCYQGTCGSLNQNNPGIGMSYEYTDNVELKAGYYENSYFKTTAYLAVTASANYRSHGFSLSPGLTVGVVTGYDETRVMADQVQPVAMASLKLQYREVRAILTYLPMRQVVGVGNDMVAMQVGIMF